MDHIAKPFPEGSSTPTCSGTLRDTLKYYLLSLTFDFVTNHSYLIIYSCSVIYQ